MKEIKSIGIIGLGKFSELMEKFLKEADSELEIKFSSRSNEIDGERFFTIDEVCNCDVVVPAVPTANFEDIIRKIAPLLGSETVVMDVCSVKIHPKKVMLDLLPNGTQIICTHPNFGPESYRINKHSTEDLNYIIENVSAKVDVWEWLLSMLSTLKFNIIEMEADDHDKKVGVPHFTSMLIGSVLNDLDMKRIEIGAASTQRMFDMVEGVGKDFQILKDMYDYNPYCKTQFEELKTTMQNISERL